MNLVALEAMLAKGMDSPLLRFGLGKAYLDQQQPEQAIVHLLACVQQDPQYSAAWQILGQAYVDHAEHDAARESWETGIAVAQAKGDKQAEKIMNVFLRRLDKQQRTD